MSVWPHYIGMGLTALAAGAMAVPLTRTWAGGDVKRDWLADELELDRVDADGSTVFLKSGACFRVFRIRGEGYDTRPRAEQDAMSKGRAEWLRRLAEAGGRGGERRRGRIGGGHGDRHRPRLVPPLMAR